MARRFCWELILSCALIIAAGISYQGERIARIVDEDTLNQRRIEALVPHQAVTVSGICCQPCPPYLRWWFCKAMSCDISTRDA